MDSFFPVLLYATLFGVVMGLGRRAHGSARFKEVTGRGGTTARLLCLALPAGLLSAPLIQWWAFVLAALVFAGATLPQRGMAMRNWHDALFLIARGVAVGLVVAPLLWWLGSPLWWLPAFVGAYAQAGYAFERMEERVGRSHEGAGECFSYGLFGVALGAALVMA